MELLVGVQMQTVLTHSTEENRLKEFLNRPFHWDEETRSLPLCSSNMILHGKNNPAIGALSWDTLTPLAMCTIASSLLLVSYSSSFCKLFGREKVLLEGIVLQFNSLMERLNNDTIFFPPNSLNTAESTLESTAYAWFCWYTQGTVNETTGEFVPSYPEEYEKVAQVKMPRRLDDPNH